MPGKLAVLALSPVASALLLNRLKLPRLVHLQLGDYLLSFFGLSGLLAWAGLGGLERRRLSPGAMSAAWQGGAGAKVTGWAVLPALLWAFAYLTIGRFSHRTWYNFKLTPTRARAMFSLFAGLLPYFLANEYVFRQAAAWKGYGLSLLSKFCLLASLVLAVYLKPELSFLTILLAPMVLVFLLIELYAIWEYGQCRDFITTGVFQALVFAWIISALFPVV